MYICDQIILCSFGSQRLKPCPGVAQCENKAAADGIEAMTNYIFFKSNRQCNRSGGESGPLLCSLKAETYSDRPTCTTFFGMLSLPWVTLGWQFDPKIIVSLMIWCAGLKRTQIPI